MMARALIAATMIAASQIALAQTNDPSRDEPASEIPPSIAKRKDEFKLDLTPAKAAVAETPSASDLAETAKKRNNEIKLDFAIPKVDNEEAVKRVADEGRARGASELDRLSRAYELQQLTKGPLDKDKPAPKAPVAGRLVLAVSSSMPEQMLRDYFAQLDGVEEAVVVLRGFVGGATLVKPTGIWMEKLTRTDPTDFRKHHHRLNIVVDPILYRDLGIERVPAVAWLPGVQDIRHCSREVYQSAVVVYGAVSVEAAAKEINHSGGQVPEQLIARLGGKPW